MNASLGGPTPTCSASRVRRLLGGELQDAALREHVAGCARCQGVVREVEQERAAVQAAVPFEKLAEGVAERLAQRKSQARRFRTAQLFAAAASVAGILLVGVTLLQQRPVAEDGVRGKGAAQLSLFALRGSRTFALPQGERVHPGDRLLPSLEADGRGSALVVWLEGTDASVLYRGPLRRGPLPEAFEWTGSVPAAELVAVLTDQPLDEAVVLQRLRSGQPALPDGVHGEVLRRHVERAP